jgi:hypothetical protein
MHASWAVCREHNRSLAGVPKHGTLILQVFTPQLQNIARR